MSPDRLAELEEERRFLLRSLRDLDAEHAVGDVDETDFTTLRDGYTTRAADVLRDIETGRGALPARSPGRWGHRLAVIAAVVAVAAVAGWLVARSSGQRTPDQSSSASVVTDDVSTLLAEARRLLGLDLVASQQLYQQVLDVRPDDPEAVTYNGWLLFVGSRDATADLRAAAVETAQGQLARAVELDPRYPDPHCFLAVIASDGGDSQTAEREGRTCLDLDAPGQLAQFVEPFLVGLNSATTPASTG
ncbi:MAG: tetratricopeptide repeat protein [Ilumatobacteraceae bacterium]